MSGDGPHVVIADDDEAICELIRFPLEQEGYRVTIARDGVSALEAASRRGVDLVILARHPGRVYSRQLLLQLVWGTSDYRDERTVDVHVHYLRNAVEEDPKRPRYIRTVRHVGYRFGVP